MNIAGITIYPEDFEEEPKQFAMTARDDNFNLVVKDSGVMKMNYKITTFVEKQTYQNLLSYLYKQVNLGLDDGTNKIVIIKALKPKFQVGYCELEIEAEEV